MYAVAKYKDTGRVFESQYYADDEIKSAIEENLLNDARMTNLDIDVAFLADIEFEELMTQ